MINQVTIEEDLLSFNCSVVVIYFYNCNRTKCKSIAPRVFARYSRIANIREKLYI